MRGARLHIAVLGIAALVGVEDAAREPRTVPAPAPAADAGVDVFGTTAIYPTAKGGREWHARWTSHPRVLWTGQVDPDDPEFTLKGRSQALDIKGDGTARSFGEQIRIYVGDRTRVKRWLNVELTLYARRISERSGIGSTGGFEFQARTADGHTSSKDVDPATGLPVQCEGHAYGFSFRNDGRALVEKEIRHPTYTPQVATNVWNGGTFPKKQWIGMKIIVYSVDGGRHVKQELWRDLADGRHGGAWAKVLEHTDSGGWSIDPAIAASCNVAPDHIITSSEPFVIVRNDGVTEQWFKKFTIREIEPPVPSDEREE